jgi:anthranilate phosphoribosyltransferase
VLEGKGAEAQTAAVALNAGAAIYVAGDSGTLADGIARATRAIETGAGASALERLREASARD